MYRFSSADARLFLAAVPDMATAARIHRLALMLKRAHGLSGRPTSPERLHVSLFFLGGLPEKMLRSACEVLSGLRMPPFEVCFDRTASFRGRTACHPFVLVGGDGLGRLRSFRRGLEIELAREGLRRPAKTNFEPHVTLLYGGHGVDEYPLAEPISWIVEEIVLIHSNAGHTHLAKWRLRA